MKTCIDYSQGLPAAAGAAGLIPLLSLVLGEGQPDGDGDDDETNDATRGTYEQNNFYEFLGSTVLSRKQQGSISENTTLDGSTYPRLKLGCVAI